MTPYMRTDDAVIISPTILGIFSWKRFMMLKVMNMARKHPPRYMILLARSASSRLDEIARMR